MVRTSEDQSQSERQDLTCSVQIHESTLCGTRAKLFVVKNKDLGSVPVAKIQFSTKMAGSSLACFQPGCSCLRVFSRLRVAFVDIVGSSPRTQASRDKHPLPPWALFYPPGDRKAHDGLHKARPKPRKRRENAAKAGGLLVLDPDGMGEI